MKRKQRSQAWTSSPVRAFAHLARDYVDLIDNLGDHTAEEFLSLCTDVLSRLYTAAARLPDLQSRGLRLDGFKKADLNRRTKDHFKLMGRIDALFGDYARFYIVFNPFKQEEPVSCSVGDCLSDIYRELKDGLANFETRNSRKQRAAAWDWHLGFHSHFGYHILEVLWAFYWMRRDYFDSDK